MKTVNVWLVSFFISFTILMSIVFGGQLYVKVLREETTKATTMQALKNEGCPTSTAPSWTFVNDGNQFYRMGINE